MNSENAASVTVEYSLSQRKSVYLYLLFAVLLPLLRIMVDTPACIGHFKVEGSDAWLLLVSI